MGGKLLIVLGTWRSTAVALGAAEVHVSHEKTKQCVFFKENVSVCKIYFLHVENATLKNGYLH